MRNNHLNLIFLSRISPMKNLDYLLQLLRRVNVPIDLSICGPLEVPEYWAECKNLISELPANIAVKYRGEVPPERVPEVFAQHDVFFLPTRGENFGHVIFESLAAGTCVVLSDRTPWQPDQTDAVEIIALDDTEAWVTALERWAMRSQEELVHCRDTALAYAHKYLAKSSALEQNRALFHSAHNRAVTF
jgi:glycosyltransferase involved in cell wall biosynthesis